MNAETFRSRLFKLLQKSRKALRLYSSMGKKQRGDASYLSDAQVREWREVNAELLKSLTSVLEIETSKGLAAGVYSLRDRFYHEWRMTESELHQRQREIVQLVESEDFAGVASLAQDLLSLKARVQALQAVHAEIQSVISQSHVSQPAITLEQETALAEEHLNDLKKRAGPEPQQAKIIQMPRRVRV